MLPQKKDDKLSSLVKSNMILTDDKEMLLSNQQRLSTVNQNLEVEKRELHSRLNKLITENDRLNGLSFELLYSIGQQYKLILTCRGLESDELQVDWVWVKNFRIHRETGRGAKPRIDHNGKTCSFF